METCHYCGSYTGDKKIYYKHSMYKKTGTIIPGASYNYTKTEVSVPRCQSCYDKHNKKIPIGNLYYRKSGEKLVNVAFSRAIRKLIIVGCSRVLFEGEKSEQISPLTRELMKDLINHVRNCPSINISDKNIGYQEDDAIKPLSYYLKK